MIYKFDPSLTEARALRPDGKIRVRQAPQARSDVGGGKKEGGRVHKSKHRRPLAFITVDDRDREWFLHRLGEACAKTGWRVHAWVLMSNHYHLMLETPEANLVEGMKWLQNTVTRRFNVKHGGWGRIFGDRYKAVIVEGRSAFYYESLWDYAARVQPLFVVTATSQPGTLICECRRECLCSGQVSDSHVMNKAR